MKFSIFFLFALTSCSTVMARDIDILILSPQENDTGMDMSQVPVYLNGMLNNTPGYDGSSCSWQGAFQVDSLMEAYYDPRHSDSTRAAVTGDYDYVVMVPYFKYLRWAPEFVFEGVFHLSQDILEAGAEPIFLMGPGESNGDLAQVGENAYRIANGCGIQVNPVGYALFDEGLFVTSLSQDQAYLVAAGIYVQITGLSASDLNYAPVANYSNLAVAADNAWNTHSSQMHYNDSRHNRGMVRYRTLDLNALPINGTARYCYTATSTEAGIKNALEPILVANGFGTEPKYIQASSSDTKAWTDGDFNVAKPHFDGRVDQIFMVYARGAASSGGQMINYNQTNLLPLTFDRHLSSIGSGTASTSNLLEDIEFGSWFRYNDYRNYNWSAVPFHIGASRLIKADPSVIVSADGTHVTTPLYNLICSMLLTSALGQDIVPSVAISGDAQSLAAFNIGKQLIKFLAYLSETEAYVPDTQLAIIRERLPVATTTLGYSHALQASNGTPPYVWTEISETGLPAGLTLSSNGVISGVATGSPGLKQIVFRVMDSSGAFRKSPFKMLVQGVNTASYTNWAAFIFDNSGLSPTNQSFSGNPDLDNMYNLFEYAAGGDPGLVDSVLINADLLNGTNYAFHYVRRGGGISEADEGYTFNELTYYIEETTNLLASSWANAGPYFTGTETRGFSNSYEQATVTFDPSLLTNGSRFLRLRVQYSE